MCIKYLIKSNVTFSFVKKKRFKLLFISYQIDLNIILSQKL